MNRKIQFTTTKWFCRRWW